MNYEEINWPPGVHQTLRPHYLRLAKSWSYLAKSYTFVESLERFLLDAHYKKRWVVAFQDMPTPPVDN
jgi:hypothetical protein